MTYQKTVPIAGNPAKAVEIMRDHFINAGFEITELTASGFKAKYPVKWPQRSASPFSKISLISVESAGGVLTIDAQIGGAGQRAGWTSAVTWIVIFLIAELTFMKDQFRLSAVAQGKFPYPFLIFPLLFGLVFWISYLSKRQAIEELLDVLTANAVKVAELK